MGYRLFMASIWGSAGDVTGEFGENKIVFKRAAPGTFFAIVGAIIVVTTILRGFEMEKSPDTNATNTLSIEKPSLPAVSPLAKE
jgi:hypothetical protein